MKYFSLHNHCYLVEGAKNLALYDLFTQRIFWITDDFWKIFLRFSNSGMDFEEIGERAVKTASEVEKCAEFFEAVDMGMRQKKPAVSQRFRPIVTREKESKEGVHRPLKEVVIEASGKCSVECDFCGFENCAVTSKCFCGIWSPLQKRISYDIGSVVQQLALYQTERITITGGDPFENRRDLYEIVNSAARNNIPVMINSPGYSLTDTDWHLFRATDTALSLIFIAENRSSAETIAAGRNPVLEQRLTDAQKHRHGKLMIKMLLGPGGYDKADQIRHYLEHRGIESVLFEKFAPLDFNRLTREYGDEILNIMSSSSHDEFAADLGTFLRLNKGHICWQDRVAIGMNGDVLPCIPMRNHAIGNVRDKQLVDILREDWADQYKNFDINGISPCRKCEFRNGCVSCSVMTLDIFGSWERRAWNCGYDPDRGEWLTSASKYN